MSNSYISNTYMSKRSLIGMAAALIVISSVAAARAQYNYEHQDPYVKPCSLDGVNPVHHPEIFGNPAVARSYGFVRARDGTWHVAPGCSANYRPH
jgi:hypothetical protein